MELTEDQKAFMEWWAAEGEELAKSCPSYFEFGTKCFQQGIDRGRFIERELAAVDED